jgi:hypothetical protein
MVFSETWLMREAWKAAFAEKPTFQERWASEE